MLTWFSGSIQFAVVYIISIPLGSKQVSLLNILAILSFSGVYFFTSLLPVSSVCSAQLMTLDHSFKDLTETQTTG